MKTKFAKKLIVLVLVFEMVFSYFTALIGTSKAANVDYAWNSSIRRYLSFVALNRASGETATRSLFLDGDTTQSHMNDLYCVRSGSALGGSYRTVDLFNIKENNMVYNGQPVFNALFASEEDYNQLMWILENMYIPSNLDSASLSAFGNQQTIMADADELSRFNQLIGGTSPFADTETVYSKYLDGWQGGVTVNKNVMLIKPVQNEILTKYIKNSYGQKCNPDLNSFFHRDANGNTTELNSAEKAYVQKMVNTLTANHTDFDVDSSLSKDYTNNNGEFYLEKEGEADATNHRSLTFKMKNPARAELTSVDVFINGEQANASQYKFINAETNEEINLINIINSGTAKDDYYKFKVEYNGEYTGEVNIKLVANIKFNNITKATLLLPYDGQTGVQTILNLERKSIDKQVSSESVAKPKIFDLALTKEITNANGKDRTRLKKITLGGLDVVNGERSATNAKYYMDKSEVEVYLENSDKVIYKITVYNEGQIDGYAEEITDYLPKQLELATNSTINNKYGWTQDSVDPQKYHTNYLSKAKSESNILRAYENGDTEESFKNKSKYVEIECTIRQSGNNAAKVEDFIDNRAEISRYGYYTEQGTFMESNGGEGTDVDSTQNNVLAKHQKANSQALVDLIENEIKNANNFNQSNDDKNKIAYEDDDDIERIVIKEENYRFDLALRKWIYKVDSPEDGITEYTETREPDMLTIYNSNDLSVITDYALDAVLGTKRRMQDNTFVYNHDKYKVPVNIGDKVIYRIAIFNEGYQTGYANEVTDYLPKGLKLVSSEESKINKENGWQETVNPDGSSTITTRILAYNPNKQSENRILNLQDAHTSRSIGGNADATAVKVLEVECIVTNDVKVKTPITNRAEITEYGYVKNGQFVECNKNNVDIDSQEKTIGTLTNPLQLEGWYYGIFDEDQPQPYVKGEQDDDDFETIYVQAIDGTQNLELYKVDSNNKPINPENIGRLFEVKRNDEDWNKLTSEGNKVTYETKYIRSTGTDTITIKEVESPKGYAKFDYTIKLYTERFLEGGRYKSKITKIELIEKDGTTVHATYTDENPEVFQEVDLIKEGQKVVGKKYRVNIEGGFVEFTTLGALSVTIQDKKIDVALMKSISKISSDGITFKDVTLDNNFNAGRYAAQDLISVNERSLRNTTNATYTAEKTPVEICKGDIIEYQIRIYNEGEVPAGAQEIKDYLPTGLEFVNVYYADEEEHLEQGDSTPNQNTYKCENNTLTIYLNNVNLIQEYQQGNGVKYNYVRVQCQVTDTATGILTNVAEISKYYDNNKDLIDDDIDSTAGNWQAPSQDRASGEWRNYSNDQDCTTRHEFVSQRTINPNGDDDDFDKLIVKGEYKVTITKQDENGVNVSDIPFTIKRQKDGREEVLANQVTSDTFPFEDSFSVVKPSEVVYIIRENENVNYDQLKSDINLTIKFNNGTMEKYSISSGNEHFNYTTSATNTYNFKSKMGNNIKVTVNFNAEENKIDLIIENTPIIEGNYSVKVKKVSAEDPNRVLSGVVFKGQKGTTQNSKDFYGQPEDFQTDPTNASGITSIKDNYEITNDNYTVVDKYKITEIDLGSTNTAYTKLNTSIAVFVTKKYNSDNAKYEMKDWAVTIDGENYTTTKNKVFNGNGKVVVDENNLRYTITATEQNGIITVTIPNMPDMPTYLNITKIDKDTNQPIQGAKMQAIIPTSGIGWLDYTNANGLLATHTNISADTTSIEYRIREIDAAPGYDNVFYGKYIKLVIGLNNGTITGITEAKVYNVADNTEDTTLTSPDWFSASVDSQNLSQVNLVMKNPITEKVVDLALKKVIVEVDGKEVKPSRGFDSKYDRITGDEVDTTPLDNGKNDAIYNLNKTPVLVQNGSKVKYQIRIYNESDEIDATASKIKDYLPTGLKLVNVYYKGDTSLTRNTDYTYDETNNVLETNILANKELIAKYVPGNGTTNGTISYDYITVECEVQKAVQSVLTNVAQITEYTTLDRDQNRVTVPDDRDSHSDNWENPNGDDNNDRTDKGTPAWSNYSGDENNNIEDGVFKDYPGQEDDDDFEKIVVGEVDLVLKKIITKIGEKPESEFSNEYKRFQNGNVNVDPSKMNNSDKVTTSDYYLNKTTIPVAKNDIITYQIRIYNEGNIDATATEIKDYIPKGMSFVKAYYNGQELSVGTDYIIDHNTNVLTIKALDTLIPAYTGTGTPSYDDKLTIECKVDGDVYGILTNVAEISEYTTFYGVTNKDRDSQTDGTGAWQAPAGTDKLTKDGKAGEPWARYYHINTKGEFNDYPGQQDDDDFEKVVIQPEYKFRLKKINAMDHNQVLSNVKFEIENQDYVTGEDGYTDYVTKELISSGLNFYIIRETELKDGFIGLRHGYRPSYGADHTEYSGTIAFGVLGQETGSGEIELTEYRFEAKTGNLNNGVRVPLNKTSFVNTYTARDVDNNDVEIKVHVIYDNDIGQYSFEIEIENTIPDEVYPIYIKKVNKNGENIGGVAFNVSADCAETYDSFTNRVAVSSLQETCIGVVHMNKDNYTYVDKFNIKEFETVNGLISLENPIKVEVTKGLKAEKNGYEIKNVKLIYGDLESVNEGTDKFVIRNIPIEGIDKTIDIIAELKDLDVVTTNGQTDITTKHKGVLITVENETIIEGNYKILLNKVKSPGKYINGSSFKIQGYNDNLETLTDFVTSPISPDGTENAKQFANATITKDNYNLIDDYVLIEEQAPRGYYQLEEPVDVWVLKELSEDGTKYVVKEFRVNNYVVPAEGLTINNVELKDAPRGVTAKVYARIGENNTLIVEVGNKEKTGDYEVYVQKVNEEGEKLEGVEFTTDGHESNGSVLGQTTISPVITDLENETQKIVDRFFGLNNLDTTDIYTIEETDVPEHYYKLKDPITLEITKKEGDTYLEINKITANGHEVVNGFVEFNAELDGTTKTAKVQVTFEDNNIVVKVENILKPNNYKVLVNKVDEDGKYLSNVKFGITGKNSADASLAGYITSPVTTDGTENAKQIIDAVIESDNYALVDNYEIEELEVPEGYFKLQNKIAVKVEKSIDKTVPEFVVSKFYVDGKEVTAEGISIPGYSLANAPEGTKAVINAKASKNELVITVENLTKEGEYKILVNKVDMAGKYLAGAEFETIGVDSNKTSLADFITSHVTTDGTEVAKEVVNRFIKKADSQTTDIYTIKEVNAPTGYYKLADTLTIKVSKKIATSYIEVDKVIVNDKEVENGKLVIENLKLEDTNKTVKATITVSENTITIVIENEFKEFDLSLRKFISELNNSELTGDKSREPVVNVDTLINGDPKKNGEKTATYTHTKEPLLVNPSDLVLYTLRIYNEGELDGYASRIIDDVPAGVTMVAPTYDEAGKPTNKNAEYRWKMFKEVSEADARANTTKEVLEYADKFYMETSVAEEAVLISTDYLSMENGQSLMKAGDTVNPNLIKAFNGSSLDYKDIKVQFKVKADNDPEKIITNFAQISNHQYKDGTPILDRDSTPNVWKDGEDDQDVEHLKVTWFDLALYKWVSSTIVTEDGKTKEYASGHTQDDKSRIVNVTVAKEKLDSTVVKFKWTIKVENQSPIPGYAKELKDHIPAGLKFVEEDNKDFGWKLQSDGTVTTDYLKDTLLQPAGSEGNTAEVTLVLRWVNGENNLGVKVNNAEISKDYNKYGAPDIDSTPNNFKDIPREDDEDKDEVRLNIKTGNVAVIAYSIIGIITIAIIACGITGIKRYVLGK